MREGGERRETEKGGNWMRMTASKETLCKSPVPVLVMKLSHLFLASKPAGSDVTLTFCAAW